MRTGTIPALGLRRWVSRPDRCLARRIAARRLAARPSRTRLRSVIHLRGLTSVRQGLSATGDLPSTTRQPDIHGQDDGRQKADVMGTGVRAWNTKSLIP